MVLFQDKSRRALCGDAPCIADRKYSRDGMTSHLGHGVFGLLDDNEEKCTGWEPSLYPVLIEIVYPVKIFTGLSISFSFFFFIH